MPWANGRGTSYEIASDRNDSGEWTWRLAMAPVNEDGPFSRIECVNRSLAVVEGAGMRLSVDRKKLQCLPMQVVQFRGDAITEATLTEGPIMDINLMLRRKKADGERNAIITTKPQMFYDCVLGLVVYFSILKCPDGITILSFFLGVSLSACSALP